MDIFTQKRLTKLIEEFRGQTGQLPTLRDLRERGFEEEVVKKAIKLELIEEFYVTLSNGTIVKGYKLFQK